MGNGLKEGISMTLIKLDSGDYINTEAVEEEWRPIPEFIGSYEVSSRGRVRSLTRIVFHTSRWGKPERQQIAGRILQPQISNVGYLRVSLRAAGHTYQRSVHRLVTDSFFGPCPAGFQVNHKDEDRTNNDVSNLEYLTPTQNNNYGNHNLRISIAKGTPVTATDVCGNQCTYHSISDAERKTGVCESNIRKCLRGLRHTAGGHQWAYAERFKG